MCSTRNSVAIGQHGLLEGQSRLRLVGGIHTPTEVAGCLLQGQFVDFSLQGEGVLAADAGWAFAVSRRRGRSATCSLMVSFTNLSLRWRARIARAAACSSVRVANRFFPCLRSFNCASCLCALSRRRRNACSTAVANWCERTTKWGSLQVRTRSASVCVTVTVRSKPTAISWRSPVASSRTSGAGTTACAQTGARYSASVASDNCFFDNGHR